MYTTRTRQTGPHLLVELTTSNGACASMNPNDTVEPKPGSIILIHGEHGTAWQRQFKGGLWVRVGGGRPRDWAWVMGQRRVFLVYDAPARQFDDNGTPTDNLFEIHVSQKASDHR